MYLRFSIAALPLSLPLIQSISLPTNKKIVAYVTSSSSSDGGVDRLGGGAVGKGRGWSRGCGIRFSSLKSHVQFTDVSHLGKHKSVKKNIHRH